jgi:hypothetical protein
MKNAYIKRIFPLLTLILLGSCGKKFLNLSPYNEIPTSGAVTDENSMQVAVNGMYASLRAVDLFGRSVPIDGDLMADNTFIGGQNSNRYLQEMLWTYIAIDGDQQNMWAEAYNTILRANVIINSKLPSDAVTQQLIGESLTVRALCYFTLVRFYALPYQTDSSSPGVPIVLTFDPFAKPARSSVGQVYQQIQSDLNQAITLLNTAKNTSYVSLPVAQGLLAKVLLTEGAYAAANAESLLVIGSGSYHLTLDSAALANYWATTAPRTDGLETLFEVEFDAVDNNGTDNLDAFYDQAGYGDALCTDTLWKIYSPTDGRRGLILPGFRNSQGVFIVNKYSNLQNANGKDNTKILRYAEILLIAAETYNRTGNDVLGLSYLDTVAKARDNSFAGYTGLTGSNLLNQIIIERRKELAFEGDRYWDLVRLGLPVIRDTANTPYLINTPGTLAVSSKARIFPIPQAEINANKNVTQNPGY